MVTPISDIDRVAWDFNAGVYFKLAPSIYRRGGNLALRRMSRFCYFNNFQYWENGDRNANTASMGSISTLSSSYLPSILGTALQAAGLTNTTGNSQSTASLASAALSRITASFHLSPTS